MMVFRIVARDSGRRTAFRFGSDGVFPSWDGARLFRRSSGVRMEGREGGKSGTAPACRGTPGRERHEKRPAAEIPGVAPRWAIAPAPGTRRAGNCGIRRRSSRRTLGLVRGCGAMGTVPGPCAGRRRRSTPTRTRPAGMRPGLGERVGTSPGTLHDAINGATSNRLGPYSRTDWTSSTSGGKPMKIASIVVIEVPNCQSIRPRWVEEGRWG
jgi:hypothetical protein